jgi:hypothetical protein
MVLENHHGGSLVVLETTNRGTEVHPSVDMSLVGNLHFSTSGGILPC